MNEPEKEGFFRRHRTAIIVAIVTLVSAVVLRKVLSGDKSGRYPFGSTSDFGKTLADMPLPTALPATLPPPLMRVDKQFRTPVVETNSNTWCPSQTVASEIFGVPQGMISRNAYGTLPLKDGLNFEFDYKVEQP